MIVPDLVRSSRGDCMQGLRLGWKLEPCGLEDGIDETLCLDSARIGVDRRLEDGVNETSCLDLVGIDLFGRVEPRRTFIG